MSNKKIKNSASQTFKKILTYFLKGLLVTLPLIITFKLVSGIIEWIDSLLLLDIPGLGFGIVLISVTIIGWGGSNIITKPFLNLMDDFFSKLPFIKIIYTSVKELMEAFVGEKKNFTKPVVVEFTVGIFKPGFITQDDLIEINQPGIVGVYFPHSYAFSGNLFFVDKSKIKPYDGNSTEFMKFIVSGGVITID